MLKFGGAGMKCKAWRKRISIVYIMLKKIKWVWVAERGGWLGLYQSDCSSEEVIFDVVEVPPIVKLFIALQPISQNSPSILTEIIDPIGFNIGEKKSTGRLSLIFKNFNFISQIHIFIFEFQHSSLKSFDHGFHRFNIFENLSYKFLFTVSTSIITMPTVL